jgi:hypothetical protein
MREQSVAGIRAISTQHGKKSDAMIRLMFSRGPRRPKGLT